MTPEGKVERLIVVSNRVAVPSRDGGSRAGGLAVAIRPVLRRHPGIWFGWSGRVAAASDVDVRAIEHGHQTYVLTDLAEEDFQEFGGTREISGRRQLRNWTKQTRDGRGAKDGRASA
jgi:trehalose-6-phosphate synthase